MKTCVTCKHYFKSNETGARRCILKGVVEVNLVDGAVEEICRLENRCSWQRDDNWLWARLSNTCGKEGRWWEPIE